LIYPQQIVSPQIKSTFYSGDILEINIDYSRPIPQHHGIATFYAWNINWFTHSEICCRKL